jgi:hypothetical protein
VHGAGAVKRRQQDVSTVRAAQEDAHGAGTAAADVGCQHKAWSGAAQECRTVSMLDSDRRNMQGHLPAVFCPLSLHVQPCVYSHLPRYTTPFVTRHLVVCA